MNICRITRAFVPLRDGVSHHTFYLSKYQARLGHRVWVIQPHHMAGERENFWIEHISLGPLTSKYGSESVTALFAFLSGLRAMALHRRHGLDLIHVHGDIVEVFVLKLFARILAIPLVVTVHARLSHKRRYRLVAPWIWRQADSVIAVSEDIALDLQGIGVNVEKIATISSGVELAYFQPHTKKNRLLARQKLGISYESFVVVSVGNLNPMKGFRYLIESIKYLSALENMQVLIIGDGPLRSELEELAAQVPVVHLVGSVPHEEIITYLHAADIFVLPSVDLPGKAEGTPTAVMEAMATGLPIVISDSGGGKYLIRESQGGIIVPQRNPKALAEAITELAKDDKLRHRMGKANRLLALTKDWRNIAARVVEVYVAAKS